MSTPIDVVIAQLQETGIVPPDKLAEFIPPAATPTDPKAWTAQLVERGLLTPFQATQTAQGKAKSLVIGSYEMVDRLTGGGGLLFKGRHRRMKRVVLIKPLAPSLMKAAGPRVLADVEALGRQQHPNILVVQDVDEVGGANFLVAEFIEATDAATLVQQQGKLPIEKACSYAAQTAAGLAHALSQGVVHRDVKAENLFVDRSGVVKVLGFGLTTNDGDAADDVRALGRTLFRMLTGTDVASAAAPLPALHTVRLEASAALDAYLARMTAENSADRPTMAEVATALASPDTLPQPAGAESADDMFPELFAGAEEEIAPEVATFSPAIETVAAPEEAVVAANESVSLIDVEPGESLDFAIDTSAKPAATATKRPRVDSPTVNIGPISSSFIVKTEAEPEAVSEELSAVVAVDSDSSDGIESFAVAESEPEDDAFGISVAPAAPVSKSAAAATARKPLSRGKKSSLPFKIDPKFLQPKYLIGGGVGAIAVLCLLVWMVVGKQVAKREEVAPPVRAVKAAAPKPAATIQFLPASDSLSTVRPSTPAPPTTSKPATSQPVTRPAPAQPETLFGLPIPPPAAKPAKPKKQ